MVWFDTTLVSWFGTFSIQGEGDNCLLCNVGNISDKNAFSKALKAVETNSAFEALRAIEAREGNLCVGS